MSDRLSDERVAGICGHGQGRSDYVLLAREVQASRKLVADLRALVTSAANPSLTFTQRDDLLQLAIVRLAGKHPDVSDFHEAIAATQPDTNEGD